MAAISESMEEFEPRQCKQVRAVIPILIGQNEPQSKQVIAQLFVIKMQRVYILRRPYYLENSENIYTIAALHTYTALIPWSFLNETRHKLYYHKNSSIALVFSRCLSFELFFLLFGLDLLLSLGFHFYHIRTIFLQYLSYFPQNKLLCGGEGIQCNLP